MTKFNKYSIDLLILFSLILSIVFYINFNKGIELTDESYVLLISMYPNDIMGRANNSGILGNFLLQIVDYNIYYFRLLGAGLLMFTSILLVNPISKFQSSILDFKNINKRFLILIFTLGTLSYYHNWIITPNYNLYNLIGILIFINGLIRFTFKNNINWKILFPMSLVILGGLISFICKPPTAIFLSLIYTIWILYFFNLKKSFIILLISIILSLFTFYAYILIFFGSIDFYLNDLMLGIELKILLDPRYSILGNFISTAKQVLFYYYSNISYLLIFFTSLFFCKALFKIFFNNFAFMLIFLPLFFTNSLLFTLLFIILFYILFDLHLTKIFKTSKKDITFLFYNFILIFILYAFVVGTNTNVVVLLKSSSLIIFLIIFNFILKIKNEKFFLVNKLDLFFYILTIFVLINLIDNFENPRRYHDNIYEQKKKVTLTNFNGEIFVDNTTFNFINEVQKVLKKNGWKKGYHLIDLTGRQPGLNIIAGARFVTEPWWGAGYVGTTKKVSKVLNISTFENIKNAWIVVTDHSLNINPKLLNLIGLDLKRDYMFVGTIKKNSLDKKYIKNYQFWKPKY